jgi:hypothetical protein
VRDDIHGVPKGLRKDGSLTPAPCRARRTILRPRGRRVHISFGGRVGRVGRVGRIPARGVSVPACCVEVSP